MRCRLAEAPERQLQRTQAASRCPCHRVHAHPLGRVGAQILLGTPDRPGCRKRPIPPEPAGIIVRHTAQHPLHEQVGERLERDRAGEQPFLGLHLRTQVSDESLQAARRRRAPVDRNVELQLLVQRAVDQGPQHALDALGRDPDVHARGVIAGQQPRPGVAAVDQPGLARRVIAPPRSGADLHAPGQDHAEAETVLRAIDDLDLGAEPVGGVAEHEVAGVTHRKPRQQPVRPSDVSRPIPQRVPVLVVRRRESAADGRIGRHLIGVIDVDHRHRFDKPLIDGDHAPTPNRRSPATAAGTHAPIEIIA